MVERFCRPLQRWASLNKLLTVICVNSLTLEVPTYCSAFNYMAPFFYKWCIWIRITKRMEDRLDKSENGSPATKILFWGRGAGTISAAFWSSFHSVRRSRKNHFWNWELSDCSHCSLIFSYGCPLPPLYNCVYT